MSDLFRTDVPFFQIADLQALDRGDEVSQHIEGEFDLKPGEVVEWEAGQNINGHAVIVSAQKPRNGFTYVTLKKR